MAVSEINVGKFYQIDTMQHVRDEFINIRSTNNNISIKKIYTWLYSIGYTYKLNEHITFLYI